MAKWKKEDDERDAKAKKELIQEAKEILDDIRFLDDEQEEGYDEALAEIKERFANLRRKESTWQSPQSKEIEETIKFAEKEREKMSNETTSSTEGRENLQKKADKVVEEDLKQKYMKISQEERVKAYEEGKNWKDLVKEKENLKNQYTSKQLKEKYGTDDVDLINTGKAKEDRVSKIGDENIASELRKADNWNDINKTIDNIKDEKVKAMMKKEAQKLEENENGAWKSSEYLAKQYNFYDKDSKRSSDKLVSTKSNKDDVAKYEVESSKSEATPMQLKREAQELMDDISFLDTDEKGEGYYESLNDIKDRYVKLRHKEGPNQSEQSKEIGEVLKKLGQEDNSPEALVNKYNRTQGVSDDWFTEEGRKRGMKDEEIAEAIYKRKGAEAQNSTDSNIKKIIAGKEKANWEEKVEKYKNIINDPKQSEEMRNFAKSELSGVEKKVKEYKGWEKEYSDRNLEKQIEHHEKKAQEYYEKS